MGSAELQLLMDAFESNWIASLGPHVDLFEKEFAALVGRPHAVALSSGTAELHLALLLNGVQPGDEVIASTCPFGQRPMRLRRCSTGCAQTSSSWCGTATWFAAMCHTAGTSSVLPR